MAENSSAMGDVSRECSQSPGRFKRPLGDANTTVMTLPSVGGSQFKPEDVQASSTPKEDGGAYKRRRISGNSDESKTFEGWSTGEETSSSGGQLLHRLEARTKQREATIREEAFAMFDVYNGRVATLEERVVKLEMENKEMKKEIVTLKEENKEMKKEVVALKEENRTMKLLHDKEMKDMKERIEELVVFILRTSANGRPAAAEEWTHA